MKAIAFITESQNHQSSQWQFDKTMATIAYDLELSIVFMFEGISQLKTNQAWKCLEIYGVKSVFMVSENHDEKLKSLINYSIINQKQLNQLVQQSDLIL